MTQEKPFPIEMQGQGVEPDVLIGVLPGGEFALVLSPRVEKILKEGGPVTKAHAVGLALLHAIRVQDPELDRFIAKTPGLEVFAKADFDAPN